jgi:murein DD-endopeptidase MepM/ murein hydrolase activator NlpD
MRETQLFVVPHSDFRSIIETYYGDIFEEYDINDIMELYESRFVYMLYSESPWFNLEGGMNSTHTYIAELIEGDDMPFTSSGFISPIDRDWRSVVSCEFGTGYVGHTGIDLAIPTGTELRAVASGRVLFTRISNVGYGIHVAIFHGIRHDGSIVTLYAHCSQILVSAGQEVSQGQVIALSGNTGNSTGPHLHLEFIVNGEVRNPRDFLP